MEVNADFQLALENSVAKRKRVIEEKSLIELREGFSTIQAAFKNIFSVLVRKSLVQEDPYKYDQKISEITIPSESPFTESEKQTQMSIRLSAYEMQFEFLNNYYQFTVDYLNLKRIKLLVKLVKYIKWENLSENSSHMNTRTLTDFLNKVKSGSDTLSTGIVNDAVNRITKTSVKILSILKTLTAFQREVYKLDLRLVVLPKISITESEANGNPDEIIRKSKRIFASEMGNHPFYPELIREILNEDYGPQKEYLREELLKRMEVKEAGPNKSVEKFSYKNLLLDSIRILAASGPYLEDIRKKILESNFILSNRKMSFSEKFKIWLNKVVGRGTDDPIYEVEIFDSRSALTKSEKINFIEFTEAMARRAKILANLTNKLSTAYVRLEASTEEKIFEFLNINIEEIQGFSRKLPALDTYIKSEIPKELRTKTRGIKIELNAIKNIIVKTNQKKHEYVSKKEEIEQLKRLGIKIDTP